MTSSPGQSRCAFLGKFALSWIGPDLVVDEAERALIQLDRIVLAIGENRERPVGLLLLLLNLRQIRISEIGSICVTTTRPVASVGWVMLPMSI